jgi:hypothetical protein
VSGFQDALGAPLFQKEPKKTYALKAACSLGRGRKTPLAKRKKA